MLSDALEQHAKKLAITASGSKIIDYGNEFDSWGQGDDPYRYHAFVNDSFNNLTSLQLTLAASADGNTWTEIFQTRAFTRAELVAGFIMINQSFPAVKVAGATRLRLSWTITGSAPSSGSFTAAPTIGSMGVRDAVLDVVNTRPGRLIA